jgi:hypothetical protein
MRARCACRWTAVRILDGSTPIIGSLDGRLPRVYAAGPRQARAAARSQHAGPREPPSAHRNGNKVGNETERTRAWRECQLALSAQIERGASTRSVAFFLPLETPTLVAQQSPPDDAVLDSARTTRAPTRWTHSEAHRTVRVSAVSSRASRTARGCTPTRRSRSCPSFKISRVGMPWMA